MEKLLFTFVVITMFAFSMNASAQDKVRSLNLGFAPYGYNHVKINGKDDKFIYDYKSYWNASVGYERQIKGVIALTEFTYASAKFDKYDVTGVPQYFNPYHSEDITSYSLFGYVGKTINPNKRIQFPLYIGVGGEYLEGGPIHNITIDIAAKARVKFYVSDNIGIFGGVSGRYGYGTKKESESSNGNKTTYYNLGNTMWYLDAGIVFGI